MSAHQLQVLDVAVGADHGGQNDLALSLWFTGRREESVALDRQTLEGRRRSLGLDHGLTDTEAADAMTGMVLAITPTPQAEQAR